MNTEQQLIEKWRNLPSDKQQQVLQFVEFLEFKDRPKSQEELGWQPGFFESTAGCLAEDPLVRYLQGEYEQRESLE